MSGLVNEVLRSIREETGENVPRVVAEVEVDKMCDAFVQRVDGVGYDYAVRMAPAVARYLARRWKGEEGKRLRAAIAAFEKGERSEPEPEPVILAHRVLVNGAIVAVDEKGKATFVGCDWLVEVASGNPEPDSYADTVTVVPCGAKVRSLDGSLDHTRCDAGHERHPYGSVEEEFLTMAEEHRARREGR